MRQKIFHKLRMRSAHKMDRQMIEPNKNMVDENKKWSILVARKKFQHAFEHFVYKFGEVNVFTVILPRLEPTYLFN